MLYEVEVRSFLKPQGYKKLENYLRQNAKLINDIQMEIVVFLTSQGDLRLVKTDQELKLVYRLGSIYQSIRPEMEVLADTKDLSELEDIFTALKFKISCRYQMKRKSFRWQGTMISLDNIRGLGLIVEIKKLVDGRKVKKYEKDLQSRLEKLLISLDLPLTTKSELKQKYLDYKKNWNKLVKKNYTKI